MIAKAGSEGVSQSQVSNLVLAERPGLDPLRLKCCVDIMWKQLDLDHFDEAEQKALFEQQIRHAKTLSPREGAAYLKKCSDEARDRAFRAFVHAWLMSLESRIFGYMPGWDPDKTTLTDVVHAIGVDGYVEAMRAELSKDAVIDGDVVVFRSARHGPHGAFLTQCNPRPSPPLCKGDSERVCRGALMSTEQVFTPPTDAPEVAA